MTTKDFLFELGCEELPANCQTELANHMATIFTQLLTENQLEHKQIETFSTPRRLAFLIHNLAEKQPDIELEKKGPSVKAAFDQNGKPTKACLGFCQSVGATVEQLTKMSTEKGDWLIYKGKKAGDKTETILPKLINTMLAKLPLNKAMSWDKNTKPFIRPVRWVVAIFGNNLIKFTCFNLNTSKKTRGHAVHHPEQITINQASEYIKTLKSVKVIAQFKTRQDIITKEIKKLETTNQQIHLDQELLDEVTNLVEWPRIHIGKFDQQYLELPSEILITAMKKHQRYFPIHDKQGQLKPEFITVANIVSNNKKRLIQGNERVLSARLADALFFFQKDSQTDPKEFIEQEKRVIFQQGLGSIHDKSMRLTKLAQTFANNFDVNVKHAEQAAQLCKFDLMTDMVNEFPTLQGIIGGYYAQKHKVATEICTAIQEHYRPTNTGDALPNTKLGALIALVDKIDTLISLFSINKIPSGTKDPFALRRQALGTTHILIEYQLDIDYTTLITAANKLLPTPANDETITKCTQFCLDRYKQWLLDQDTPSLQLEALFETAVTSPYDLKQRLVAVQIFLQLPEAQALTSANKRIHNLLKKQTNIPTTITKSLLQEPQEKQLHDIIIPMQKQIKQMMQQKDYSSALHLLASLKQPVDSFFDNIMVMTEDNKVRNNRLALLQQLANLCNSVIPMNRL